MAAGRHGAVGGAGTPGERVPKAAGVLRTCARPSPAAGRLLRRVGEAGDADGLALAEGGQRRRDDVRRQHAVHVVDARQLAWGRLVDSPPEEALMFSCLGKTPSSVWR